MADAFLGEIRVFAGNFAPRDWAFCDGSLLPIPQFTALFSILGTQYGGNGTTVFALPDLRGAAPISQGAGLGLTPRVVGEQVGSQTVTLQTSEMPAHTHTPMAINQPSGLSDPTNNLWGETAAVGRPPQQISVYAPTINATMVPTALAASGGSGPHNNMQPYLTMNFIICMNGMFPPRG